MRFVSYVGMLICSSVIYATEVTIKVIPLDGKPAYVLQVGSEPTQEAAQALQKKLSESIKQPMTVTEKSEKGPFMVDIGPISDYMVARDLEKTIMDASPKKDAPKEKVRDLTLKDISPQKIWNLREADIQAVIAEVSRVTHKNFLIDPRVTGKISIVASSPMTDKEIYQVFLSMLQVSGFAAVPSGDVVKIVPIGEARMGSDNLNRMKSPPQGDEMMVQVIPVHYVPSEQLIPVLRPLMPQWSNITAYPPSNMIILSGPASNMKQIAEIIEQVDSSSSSGIDIIPLKHALAMDVASTLKDLMKAPTAGPGARSQAVVSVDDRSNAILLNGSKTERIRLRLLIARLDQQNLNGTNSNTQVIYLSYLRAEDVVPILAGIAQASFSGNVGTTIGTITRPVLDSTNPASNIQTNSPLNTNAAAPSPTGGASMPNTMNAASQSEGSSKPSMQIIAEPNTNSVIINAPATLITTLKNVIRQLDIKPAQLLIEALVAEINETDFNDLGLEWGSIDQKKLDPASFRPGFAILNAQTSIDQFQAQIYALARLHKANILSTPSVIVLDNRQAKILIGKQVSVASSSYPNNGNGSTVGSPFTTFDRVNVALHLYVRPQITHGKGIQMQIDQGNDTLDTVSAVDPGTNPTFNISSIVTSVHVESGDIVVLGGLSQDSLGNNSNSIPILGDIPGLGKLFQRNISNREKKVLMVFIRPRILRTELDATQMTGGKYDDLRQDQLAWLRTQKYDERNKRTVLAPLQASELPMPFSQPPMMQTK
jgi:general secretion pathway protein D